MYLKHKLFCLKDWSVTFLCLGCSTNIKNLLKLIYRLYQYFYLVRSNCELYIPKFRLFRFSNMYDDTQPDFEPHPTLHNRDPESLIFSVILLFLPMEFLCSI